jgi:hypothetical protein
MRQETAACVLDDRLEMERTFVKFIDDGVNRKKFSHL